MSEGIKYDSNKIRFELLPPELLEQTAAVLTVGAVKYEDRNWEGGIKYSLTLLVVSPFLFRTNKEIW